MIDPGTRHPDTFKRPEYPIEEQKKVLERCFKDPFFFFNLILSRIPRKNK